MAAVGIFDRVAGLPMVQSTYGKVSEVYSSAKERNSLVNFALSTVEASVQVVATSAQPIVSSLEKPIAHADAFACRQFDYLEEKVPSIQATPEECSQVISDTKQYVSDKLQASADAVSTPVVKLVSSRLDHVLNVTERVVDFCLPDTAHTESVLTEDNEDEEEDDADVAPSTFSRITSISSKVSTRTQSLAIQQVNNAQMRANKALQELRTNLILIDRANAYIQEQQNRVTTFVEEGRASARAHVAASSQRIVTAAHAHSQTLRSGFSTLTATIPASVQLPGGSVIHLDAMLLSVTRLTASTQASLQTLAALARHMPQHLHRPIELALEQSRSLNNMALEIARGNPLTRSMLDKATSLISAISTATNDISDFVRSRLRPSTAGDQDDVEMEDEGSSDEKEPLPLKAVLARGKEQLEDDEDDDGSTEI